MLNNLFSEIRKTLIDSASPEIKSGAEKYFRYVINYHGVKAPDVFKISRAFYQKSVKSLSQTDKMSLVQLLFSSGFSEEKSVAIDILRRELKNLKPEIIPVLADIIDQHVYDWGTCDSLSGKVVSKLILHYPETSFQVSLWKNASHSWRKRACCISFVNLARHGNYNDLIFDICDTCLKNQDRFVQLGAGWVLRELSLADRKRVTDFIKSRYHLFIRESLRYAIEKMPSDLRTELLKFTP